MKIGEVSRRSGVSARSLRYYEQHGLISARRESNGYRDYDDSTVERAEIIHMLFGMDFPREVVVSVLACTGDAPADAHRRAREAARAGAGGVGGADRETDRDAPAGERVVGRAGALSSHLPRDDIAHDTKPLR